MKTRQKIICTGVLLFVFLLAGIFCLTVNKVSAILEVHYPTIANQTIGANTKLPDFIRYIFNLIMFIGFFTAFISLIIGGVMYLLSPINAQLQSDAKDRIFGAISGFLILILTYLVIITINPQLSLFRFDDLPQTPSPPPITRPAGIYFYRQPGCPAINSSQPVASNVPDLGNLKNRINSIGIVQGANPLTGYLVILYDAINFQGKCLFLDPNRSCQNIAPFAASASVLTYNHNPNGDGVYFYRRPNFNPQGGYFQVNNSDIANIYVGKLDDLRFTGVPVNEQDCTGYNENGDCVSRSPPSLAGQNIASVKISRDYVVLFVYIGPQDNPSGPWTSCQLFPDVDDIYGQGPRQMRWVNARNVGGVVPNYVIIIPSQRQ